MYRFMKRCQLQWTKYILVVFLATNLILLHYGTYEPNNYRPKGNKVQEFDSRHTTISLADQQQTEMADWVGVVRNDVNLFLYSAFYDERILGGRLPVAHVVVVGVWYRMDDAMYCGIWADENNLLHVSVAQVHALWLGKRIPDSNSTFVMHCPITGANNIVPKFISIDRNSTRVQDINAAKIFIETPVKPQRKMKFAICLKAVYKIPNSLPTPPEYLIEWIELNKLLGVERIYVYNHSMGAEQSEIFEYYAEKDFVDIFSHSSVPSYDVSKDPMPDLISSSNDCMFRFMYSVKKIVHIDTDEIIAPFRLTNLSELLLQVSKMNNATVEGTIFEFSNQRYFVDDPRVKPGPLFSQFAVRHVAPEAPDVRQKSIVDPATCLSLNSHYCEQYVPGTRVIRVPTDIAASLHYKACRTSRFESKPKNCSETLKHSVEDLSMRKFQKQLELNVERVMADMENFQLY